MSDPDKKTEEPLGLDAMSVEQLTKHIENYDAQYKAERKYLVALLKAKQVRVPTITLVDNQKKA